MTTRNKIEGRTTLHSLFSVLADYDLYLGRMKLDKDGYFVTLSEDNGQPIAIGLGPTFAEAIEDALVDVDALERPYG
jgi:hypothetical protein